MGLKKLKVIGNGDAFGTGGKLHTCFYLKSSESKFLIDLGATAISRLQSEVDINDINLIIISHLHGDHFGGIPYFLLNSAFQTKRETPLTILGPKGSQERIESLTDNLYKGITSKMARFDLKFIEYEADVPVRFNDLEIHTLSSVHSDDAESHCIRVLSGSTRFAYSGDTEWTDNLLKISEEADLFICECTYYSSEMEGHINYKQLKEKILEITAKKILLTHMGQEMLNEENRERVEIEFSEEGREYNF